MTRGQSTGRLLMIGAAVEFFLFFIGVMRRSYLAIALPVTAAMVALTALTFWIGWTMFTAEEEIEEPPRSDA
jgi:hypothetical protein